MNKQKFVSGCMLIIAVTLIAMAWHAPVNQETTGNMSGIHAQNNGYMTSISTLVDALSISASRGAKGYYTLSGNSCNIEMNVYIFNSQGYSRYNSGQNVTPYRSFRLYPSRKWVFLAPDSDIYYIMYRPATTFSGNIYVSTYAQADTSAPTISTNLQNMMNLNSTFTIQVTATDLFQVSYIGIEINNELKAEVFNSSTISYAWTPDTNFQQMNIVKLTAWDQFSQVSESTYYIIGADRTCPVVTWNGPGSTVSGSSVLLYISYSDNVALKRFKVLMNGSQLYNQEYSSSNYYTVSDSAYFYWNTLGLANGPVTLTAIAWDQKGLNKTSSIIVKVDNDHTPPSLSWVTTSTTVSGSSVPIVVSASDDHVVYRVEFWINNYRYDYTYPNSQSATVTFYFNSQYYSNGQVLIQVMACDSAGNSNTISRYFTINNDCTYPTASWQSIPSDVSGTIDVSVRVWDDKAVSWVELYANNYDLINKIYNPVNNAIVHFTIDTTRYSNGYLYLRVVVCDTAGHQTSIDKNVYVTNGGSSTTTTSSANTTGVGVAIGVSIVILMIIIFAVIAAKKAQKNVPNAVLHTSGSANRPSTASSASSRPSTASSTSSRPSASSSASSRPLTASSASSRPSAASSASSRPSAASSASSRPSAASSASRRPASQALVRSNLPASCFVSTIQATPRSGSRTRANSSTGTKASASKRSQAKPTSRARAQPRVPAATPANAAPSNQDTSGFSDTYWEVIEGIRTRMRAPAVSAPAPKPKKKAKARVTPRMNPALAPKTSRMYVDGASLNDVKPWDDGSTSNTPASEPMLFCKTCNMPVIPDSTNPDAVQYCTACGSVLMHLVPISAVDRPNVTNADPDFQAFIKLVSWMHSRNAIPPTGRMNKARLNIILNDTGNGNIDLKHFTDKMLRTRLFVAETQKTVVLAKAVMEHASLDDLLVYLAAYLRDM